MLHNRIIQQLCIRSLAGNHKGKIAFPCRCLSIKGICHIHPFNSIQLPDCFHILSSDVLFSSHCIITDTDRNLSAADIVNLAVHLILGPLTNGNDCNNRSNTDNNSQHGKKRSSLICRDIVNCHFYVFIQVNHQHRLLFHS